MFAIAKSLFFFFFNDTATTEIYTLSLHDALPISHSCTRACEIRHAGAHLATNLRCSVAFRSRLGDRKSTRLNSSHLVISYAVFCLKKKTNSPGPSAIATPTTRRSAATATPTELAA